MTLPQLAVRGVFGIGLAAAIAAPAMATAVPCAGGTLDFTATSDTPATGSTFNVGQKTTLTAVTTGFTASSYSWSIPPPHVKDYNDDLGTQAGVSTPLPWSTTPLTPADLAASEVSFYWKPSAAQTHPLTGGPEARVVSLTVTPTTGGSCTSSATFMIERNLTDPDKQPEDFYTSTHRAPTETNPGRGHLIDEHEYWHLAVGGGTDWRQFLAWHGYFLRRFDEWRAEFGYADVAPWYPGRPLPTGPAFDQDASLRLPYDPDANRIPTYFTIAGGSASDFMGRTKLSDYSTLPDFSDLFEGSFHGDIHCNIGVWPGFGSMCDFSSPKDPMFWRWHGFIERLYRNYCKLKGLTCESPVDAASDPWMGDNPADIGAVGAEPSPAPHWISPDVWNRGAEVTTDACIPRDPPPNLNTVGGVVRDCGSSADHENPVAGVTNYLYATLRNTRPSPTRNVYAEVAVYIANASTGLSWDTDFTMLPESRQFITLNLEPGQVTDIGPLPWTPPTPTPSDHWCIYIRVLSVQEPPLVETTNIDSNVGNSNSIAWRNLKIVEPGMDVKVSEFIVRNVQPADERLTLRIEAAPALLQTGQLVLGLDGTLQRGFAAGNGKLEGLRPSSTPGTFAVTAAKATVTGIRLASRQSGGAKVQLRGSGAAEGEVVVTQVSSKGVDGGVVLRVAKKGTAGAPEDCTTTAVVSGIHFPNKSCAQSAAEFQATLLTSFHFTSRCPQGAPLKAVFDVSCRDAPVPGFPTGSVYQGTACCTTRTTVPIPTVTISNLSTQGGIKATPCPALGVAYKRADAATVPYLGFLLANLDKQCRSKGRQLRMETVTFRQCAPDPRRGYGPLATADVTCGK